MTLGGVQVRYVTSSLLLTTGLGIWTATKIKGNIQRTRQGRRDAWATGDRTNTHSLTHSHTHTKQ